MTKNKAARKRPRAAPGTAGAAALLSGREEIGRRQRTIAVKMCVYGRDAIVMTVALLHAREGPMASPPVCTRPRLQTQHACLQTCITPCCVCQEMANLCEREIRLHVCKRPFTARLERLQTCVHAVLASVKMNNCMFANVTLN